jgi:hypothetical protein
MNAAVLKGLLSLAAALVFFGVSGVLFLTRRGLYPALQALGLGCFGVMALTHVFQEFSLLDSLGWGQPHSVGHFIDLAAALLGVTLVTTSFLLWCRDQRRSGLESHGTVAPRDSRRDRP